MSPGCACNGPQNLISRAPARAHTLASFPLTESGGKDARVCDWNIYVYM
nr:MAG TPA: hypothetical protein [Caudoviricetes sp.]